ncbi:hypothetical protein COD02_28600 [Bacillus thuringiensis]|nr:hypothetical protein COD02_28600 [Bacillus thuringiensis]
MMVNEKQQLVYKRAISMTEKGYILIGKRER